jgi:hypothetical protein
METIRARFNKRMVLICCLTILITQSATFCAKQRSALPRKITWRSTSVSKIEVTPSDYNSAIIENHNFLYYSPIVISQETIWRVGPWMGNGPTLRATAYEIMPNGKHKEIWSINEEADEGNIEERGFYQTIWYGCCGSVPNHRLYNIKTGNLITEYDGKLLEIEMHRPGLVRYIGYKPGGTIALNSWEKDKKHIGTLTYSSSKGIIRRIAFRGIRDDYMHIFGFGFAKVSLEDDGRGHLYNGQRLVLNVPVSSADEKLFSGFRVRLEFYDGFTIIIPIIEDDFFLETDRFKDYEILRVGLN